MREIKFRVWNGNDEIKGNTMYYDAMVGGFDQTVPSVYIDDRGWVNVVPYTVMQFTGLKDKNGKEIYEGDIIEFTDKWEWYRGSYAIKMMFADVDKRKELQAEFDALPMHRRAVTIDYEGINFSKYDLDQGRWEVVGNIYENPELLEGGKQCLSL